MTPETGNKCPRTLATYRGEYIRYFSSIVVWSFFVKLYFLFEDCFIVFEAEVSTLNLNVRLLSYKSPVINNLRIGFNQLFYTKMYWGREVLDTGWWLSRYRKIVSSFELYSPGGTKLAIECINVGWNSWRRLIVQWAWPRTSTSAILYRTIRTIAASRMCLYTITSIVYHSTRRVSL